MQRSLVRIVDCLSRLPTSTTEMTFWPKFLETFTTTPTQEVHDKTGPVENKGEIFSLQPKSGSVIIQGSEEQMTPPPFV